MGSKEIKICFEILVHASLYSVHSNFYEALFSLVAILSNSHFLLRFGEKANVMPSLLSPPPPSCSRIRNYFKSFYVIKTSPASLSFSIWVSPCILFSMPRQLLVFLLGLTHLGRRGERQLWKSTDSFLSLVLLGPQPKRRFYYR